MDKYLNYDPATDMQPVVGSPAWPIFRFESLQSTSTPYWTYGLCEQAIPDPDEEIDPSEKKGLRLVSYDENFVQKKDCKCMAGKGHAWEPWNDLNVDVDYFFGYREGCLVDED
jgi:hypothetical protein